MKFGDKGHVAAGGMMVGNIPVAILCWAETRERVEVTAKIHIRILRQIAEKWLSEQD